ncbi:hypothetical protein [Marinobacter sp. KMM 10035]|uniref:hypothetical protein n=1 Tax=Marinobacter sp. KMM 10035 TaxID=3134034 RepID=UPI0039789853
MSDALQVFLKSDLVPGLNNAVLRLQEKGLELEEWEKASSLTDVDGFWPGKLNGEDAGFEFSIEEVDDDDLEAWDVERSQLEGRDLMMELCYYTEMDLAAAVLFISFICESCNGITFDENDELTVTAANSKQWREALLGQIL